MRQAQGHGPAFDFMEPTVQMITIVSIPMLTRCTHIPSNIQLVYRNVILEVKPGRYGYLVKLVFASKPV